MNKHWEICKIVIIYALFGGCWIYFSDTALGWFVSSPELMTKLAISKGLLFIITTSVLLTLLIARLDAKIKQSIYALRESEERLRLLVKNSSDSLVILNADESQRYVSPAAERITGFPIAELAGRSLDTLIHPDDLPEVLAAWNEAVEHPEKTVTVQYRHDFNNMLGVILAHAEIGLDRLDPAQPVFANLQEIGKGTGLGLATVYGIVKQNNGFINVYSEPGLGTTFKIYLPRHSAKTKWSTKSEEAPPAARGHETILLVEDEPMILDMTQTMLKLQGYNVLPAATPGEAIGLARDHAGEIHLLMTDVI